jgi:hypothetical protein
MCQGTSEDVIFHLTRVHQTQENAFKSAQLRGSRAAFAQIDDSAVLDPNRR